MIFKIRIWFRYVQKGDQEKDLEDYEIEALSVHDAFKKIKKMYLDGYNAKPFKYGQIINNEVYTWYTPFSINIKDENFDLTWKELTEKLNINIKP